MQLWEGRLRSDLAVSNIETSSFTPFYLQPTVGGSDISSQVSLRGLLDYRLCDRDAVFVQDEYSVLILDPVGLLVSYDAVRVGSTLSDLTLANLRQDAGFVATSVVSAFGIGTSVLAEAVAIIAEQL